MGTGNNDPIVVSIGKLLTVMGKQDNNFKFQNIVKDIGI